jgi:hypothetical protein
MSAAPSAASRRIQFPFRSSAAMYYLYTHNTLSDGVLAFAELPRRFQKQL